MASPLTRDEIREASRPLAEELGQLFNVGDVFRVHSLSRRWIEYEMTILPEGIAVHIGEGCEGEIFNGPTGCWHSKEYSMTSQQVTKYEPPSSPVEIRFNDAQLAVIKNTIAKGASDTELQLFVATCTRTGLDPFLKQIYAIQRRSQVNGQWVTAMSIQVAIDGLRLIAERTSKYAGQLPPSWLDADGVWHDVWMSEGNPVAAKCAVLRHDFKEPVWAVARWQSYVQTGQSGEPTSMWRKMPDVMLAKCAEALALRRAFPAEMSGLAAAIDAEYDAEYDAEAFTQENEQAAGYIEEPPASDELFAGMIKGEVIDAEPGPEPPADLPQGKYDDTVHAFWDITRNELGMSRDEVLAECEKRYPGREPMDLKPKQELSALLAALRAMKTTQPKQAALPT